jgi:hypothetical protein
MHGTMHQSNIHFTQTLFTAEFIFNAEKYIYCKKNQHHASLYANKLLLFHAVTKRINQAGSRSNGVNHMSVACGERQPDQGNVFGLVVYHDSYLLCLFLFV